MRRINSLVMQMGNTDSFCTANVLGGAISGKTAQNELQMKLAGSVQSGTTSILLKLMSLDDLTGKADPALSLGVMSGMPDSSSSATYDGTSDVDWWYVADKTGLDANRNPTAQLSGAINASTLTTTAGNLTLTVNLGGSVATLTTSALAQGTHMITATYGGDVNNAASTSPAVQQVVNAVVIPPPAGTVQPIPTLGELALLLLGALVAMTGIAGIRRYRR